MSPGFHPLLAALLLRLTFSFPLLRSSHGQADREARSLFQLALQRNRPAVALDDPLRGGKTEPRASFLQGIERMEDLLLLFLGDSLSRIRDLQDDLIVYARGPYDQFTALGHGLKAVQEKVHQGLLKPF